MQRAAKIIDANATKENVIMATLNIPDDETDQAKLVQLIQQELKQPRPM